MKNVIQFNISFQKIFMNILGISSAEQLDCYTRDLKPYDSNGICTQDFKNNTEAGHDIKRIEEANDAYVSQNS